MSTLSSANVTDVNLVLKERAHKIKIKYSMHQYSICLHNLGNWLIMTQTCVAVSQSYPAAITSINRLIIKILNYYKTVAWQK